MEGQRFAEWLTTQGRGLLDAEATAKLGELVQSVSDVGKKGKLVLTVVVTPAGAGGRSVAIGGVVTIAKPVPDPELGVYFVGESGALHRNDPYAVRLPGMEAPEPSQEVRVVIPETGEIREVPLAPPLLPVEEAAAAEGPLEVTDEEVTGDE